MRDYIFRFVSNLLKPRIVLAESASALFELSGYKDLVEFEVDIAQICSLVALVSETAGSLVELGAFTARDDIAKTLYVIVHEDLHGHTKSFVRLGPFLVLENMSAGQIDMVGNFNWKTRKDSTVVRKSVHNQRKVIASAINERSKTGWEKFNPDSSAHVMIVIHWICHILRCARQIEIRFYLEKFGIIADPSRVKKYIYCMQVAGWLGEKNVGSPFYYPMVDRDPFDYAYKAGVSEKSNKRWKLAVTDEVRKSTAARPVQVLDLIGGSYD